jgi:outer membrane protein OmpA-like peptidoglycan-associated protein
MTTLAANGTPVDQQLPPDESAKRPMMDEPASNAENNSAKPQEMKDIATPEAVKSAPRRRLTAPGIQFKADSEKINFDDPATRTNLNEILEFLRESCEELKVMIEGHASSEGPAIRNQQLSILRAREVAKWLFSQGVPAEKVQGAVGMGSSMPKIAEPSPSVAKRMSKEQLEAIREQNRRIELEILEDCK